MTGMSATNIRHSHSEGDSTCTDPKCADNQRLGLETMLVEKMLYYKMFANADQIRNFTSCLNHSSEG
jgi:hypothetical protein